MANAPDFSALTESPRWPILFVHHGWGGGIARHIADLQRLISHRCEVISLMPEKPGTPGGRIRVFWQRGTNSIDGYFSLPEEKALLVDALKALGIVRAHFHHVHTLPPEVLSLPEQLGVPYDITLHDYFPITPAYHLTDWRGRFNPAILASDVPPVTFQGWPETHEQWRALFRPFMQKADRVIAPSHDIAERIHHYLPVFDIDVWPHPERWTIAPERARVVSLGALARDKGFDVVCACARDAEKRKLPLTFRHIGSVLSAFTDDMPPSRLSMSGEYAEDDLADLIAAEKPDIFFFPAQFPESFCYALTPALASDVPVVASDLGALPERLKASGKDKITLLPFDAPAEQWNEALMKYAHSVGQTERRSADNEAEYANRYLSVLPSGEKAQSKATATIPWAQSEPVSDKTDITLTELFYAGVDCGKKDARMQLRRELETLEREAQQRKETMMPEWLTGLTRNLMRSVLVARRARRMFGNAFKVLRTEGVVSLFKRTHGKLFPKKIEKVWTQYTQETHIAPLTLNTSGLPRVSILIPAFGEALMTFSCLKSIAEHTRDIAFEVLVLDDASPTPLAQELKEVSGVRFIRQNHNLGFLRNCNAGAKEARGEILVFLNNDTLVTEHWLSALLETLDNVENAGMVGAQLCYPDGRLQEAGGIVFRDGSAWNYGRNDDPDAPDYRYLRDVDYCSGACIALSRDLFERIGGFDERYVPAYYEDTDLAFAVRAQGKRVLYQPMARVIHFEGVTSGTDETQGVKRHQLINQAVFAEKWKAVLAQHPQSPHQPNPRAATEHHVKMKILVIDACMITPDRDSGSLRMWQILSLLATETHQVTFAAANLEYRAPYVEDLQAQGIRVMCRPYCNTINQLLDERGSEFDLVILSRLEVAAQWLYAVRKKAPQAFVVFDTVDLHFLRTQREAEVLGDKQIMKRAEAQKKQELALMRATDQTWVVSSEEKRMLAQIVPDAEIALLSNIHELVPAGKPYNARTGILFIGSFRHPPNVDAMLWYGKEVLPHLRKLLPGVVSTIIGGDVPPSVKALAANDFVVTGYIEDIDPYFADTRISIAPLRYGAGVKGKINQAMSYGIPVVATTVAAEGMYLTDGENALIADDALAFAEAIARVYQDAGLWQKIATAGRENIANHFSIARAQETIETTLQKIRH